MKVRLRFILSPVLKQQLNKVSVIFNTKVLILPAIWINNDGIGCYLKKETISAMDFMLIPINWVPASYILKFLPSHLMAFSLSLNSIPFFTCCSMISHAAAIAAHPSYFATAVIFSVQDIWCLLFSPYGRENDKITRNCAFLCFSTAVLHLHLLLCKELIYFIWPIETESTKQKNIFHF